VLGTTSPITALRGRLFHVGGRRIVPIFHPAAALYDGSKRGVLFDDFKRLRAVMERAEGGERSEAGAADGGQPVLFEER